MSPPTRAFSSSIATKLVIGITGLSLFLYLVIHIAGNLLVFFGPTVFNRYAFVMEHGNPLVPVIEIGLLLIFLLHLYKTVTMFVSNQRARPVSYQKKRFAGKPSRKTLASATMVVSGLWLLLFIIVHVNAFKYSPEYPWPAGGRDLYRQEMETFTSPLMVGFYILSMLVVGSHLWHGLSSSLQSLGVDFSGHPTWTPKVLAAGKVVAVLMAGGFIVIALWAHFAGGQL